MQTIKSTELPVFTVHDDPKDAIVNSHKLLIRAGFIKKQSSGFYTYMPFGLMVLQKIEAIIREEMNKSGGIEVKLPVLTDSKLWKTSGRWSKWGKEMMRMQDRHGNDFVLGPTHEEAMSSLASSYLQSYKQLPLNFYQIGTKYRDEIRPRYGLIRCREFTMKDAYSFHIDVESLDNTYRKMSETYKRIFSRVSLKTIAVQADTGAMGGSGSEEYMVPSEIGEETLLLCKENDYRSNQEKTEFVPTVPYPNEESKDAAQEVETPNKKTIDEVAEFLGLNANNFVKTLIFENEAAVVIAFIPGDREINEFKLAGVSGYQNLELATPHTIKIVTGSEPGYAGPMNLKTAHLENCVVNEEEKQVLIYFDRNIKGRGNLISGANKENFHIKNLQEGRDFAIPDDQGNMDLVLAKEGDATPSDPSHKLYATKGIEVGHIFKLGKDYSEKFNISVLDKNGKPLIVTMGTYGIGVGRTFATIVEQHHDDKGIIWPEAVSPFKYHLIAIYKNDEQKQQIDELYSSLKEAGFSVYYDDRKESPGVKFADADLIGFPFQIVAGKTYLNDGKLEIKNRKNGERELLTKVELLEK